MQSFRIDFAMNHGHEMIIDREYGLDRSELDEIELHMLRSERIPYLLPIDWLELDSKVTFRYKLSGMRILLHRLQQQPLTMEQYYTLILGVIDALFECKHYMLRPEGCLLDEQFIFSGEKLHDIRLAYLPIKTGTEEQTRGSGDLLSLIVRFTTYVDNIDGEGLKRVLQHLIGKRWPLDELRSSLLDLIGETSSKQRSNIEKGMEKHQAPKFFPVEKDSPLVLQKKFQQPIIQEQLQSLPSNMPLLPHNLPPDKEEFSKHPFSSENHFSDPLYADDYYYEDDKDESSKKKKWIGTVSLIIAISCVWRFVYFEAASRQSLLICLGVSLLLVAAMMLIWRKRTNEDNTDDGTEVELGEMTFNSGIFPRLDRAYPKHDESEANASKKQDDHYKINEAHPAASLHVVAANPVPDIIEPTVLLSSHQPMDDSSNPAMWLQRKWEGQDTIVELIEGCFKIGRLGEQVNYADAASGISRLHLEIESFEGEYKVKDLGSRNGSLLNGQKMVPYKSYTFLIGDIIHLAGEQGPKYELKSG